MSSLIDRSFDYHRPDEAAATMHQALRDGCKELARLMEHLLPPSHEKLLARDKLEEAMFWGDAAIARDGH